MVDKLTRDPGGTGILITDCNKLHGRPPTTAALKLSGWEPITQHSAGLAEVAGVDLKWCHGKHWAPTWFLKFLKGVPEMAGRVGAKNAYVFLHSLRRKQLVYVVGLLVSKNEVDADDVSFLVARVLARPVVFGAIRIHPDGRAEITPDGRTTWVPAPEEICRGLDAENRLTGTTSALHEAAQILLDAYEKDRNGQER